MYRNISALTIIEITDRLLGLSNIFDQLFNIRCTNTWLNLVVK